MLCTINLEKFISIGNEGKKEVMANVTVVD